MRNAMQTHFLTQTHPVEHETLANESRGEGSSAFGKRHSIWEGRKNPFGIWFKGGRYAVFAPMDA